MEAKQRNFNNLFVTIVFKSSSPDWFIKFISGVIDLGGTMLIASFRTSPSPPPNHPQSEDKPCKPANQPATEYDRKWEWETHCWGLATTTHAAFSIDNKPLSNKSQLSAAHTKPEVERHWYRGSIYIYISKYINLLMCVLCGFCTRIELMVNWKE